MSRVFALLALMLTTPALAALDPSDAGEYAVVHRDGHVTEMVFRTAWQEGKWSIERRMPDGTWDNVTCETDCVLADSSPADIERFFGKLPEGVHAECTHNKAFAFCRGTDDALPGKRRYLLVALKTSPPVVIKLEPTGPQVGWRDRQGSAVADAEHQKSVEGFGGLVIVTPDTDWEKKWATPADTTPHFSSIKDVKRGKEIFVLTFFANPKLTAEGIADVTCDIEIVRPDGKFSMQQSDAVCYKGSIGNPLNMHLVEPVIGFVGEPSDPVGEWVVRITLKDNLRNVSVPLKTSFVLVD